ncbi:GNAT family N-acetyltransferase [Spongiibacter tropicus]|uniref:GNAT family N-acetyltransferase n=1 Tax=Spongiibacter tropicus TaxID=454602 RepID=UPI0012F9BD83|nr:GNAT family N-acetyltransferase [Spongiibacter tropicus]
MSTEPSAEFRFLDTEKDVIPCFSLMQQLRPHLCSEDEFVERWRRQTDGGYRLAALVVGECIVALAGFRIQDNMIHGRHFYVDDLVTDQQSRSAGHGHVLMRHLKQEAGRLGLEKFILDTPLSNTLGHRFYYREDMLATALRFSYTLPSRLDEYTSY